MHRDPWVLPAACPTPRGHPAKSSGRVQGPLRPREKGPPGLACQHLNPASSERGGTSLRSDERSTSPESVFEIPGIGVTIPAFVNDCRSIPYGWLSPTVLPSLPRRPVLDMRTFANRMGTRRRDARVIERFSHPGRVRPLLNVWSHTSVPSMSGFWRFSAGLSWPVGSSSSCGPRSAARAPLRPARRSVSRSRAGARRPRTTPTTLHDAHGPRARSRHPWTRSPELQVTPPAGPAGPTCVNCSAVVRPGTRSPPAKAAARRRTAVSDLGRYSTCSTTTLMCRVPDGSHMCRCPCTFTQPSGTWRSGTCVRSSSGLPGAYTALKTSSKPSRCPPTVPSNS